jgi:Uma2 family endonuclease
VNSTFAAGDDSETLPDVAVVPLGDYESSYPRAAHLLIEVALSSLRKDRNIKAPIYAEGEVAEYWIVDVNDHAIDAHRKPLNGRYSETQRYERGETLPLAAFPDVTVSVDAIIG